MIQRIIGYIARLIQCQICPEMMVLTLLYCESCHSFFSISLNIAVMPDITVTTQKQIANFF